MKLLAMVAPKAWVRGRIPVKVSSGPKPKIREKPAQNGRLRRLLARVWGVIALSDADFPAAAALGRQPQGRTPGPRCARPRRRVLQPFPRRSFHVGDRPPKCCAGAPAQRRRLTTLAALSDIHAFVGVGTVCIFSGARFGHLESQPLRRFESS